ncbi:uncharacterized protein LOC130796908 [Amaranthus tricolor]|uniref:uncharacterized protein LOC130796908 n=1 Tax=Amaranthus tricolor TaxID=29722 RepID=UPI002585B0C7|nr:uncharacterized protein LOC130796908 [Amaranthus tricolor]
MTGSGSGSGSGSPTKSMISRRTSTSASTGWVRCCLISFAVISALCVSAPALYWRFQHSTTTASSSLTNNAHSCPPCSCHCPSPPSLLQIAPGLANLSVPDCNSSDPDLKKEMAKQFVDLLTEELKLQEGVAAEHALHMNATLTEARRVASQYQREADKCIAATETCEGAREHSEALLRKEMKLTSLWERRARKMGWEGE